MTETGKHCTNPNCQECLKNYRGLVLDALSEAALAAKKDFNADTFYNLLVAFNRLDTAR